jgi:hypothetical protein
MVTIYCLIFSKCNSLSVDLTLMLFSTGRQAVLHSFYCRLRKSSTHEPVLDQTPSVQPHAFLPDSARKNQF